MKLEKAGCALTLSSYWEKVHGCSTDSSFLVTRLPTDFTFHIVSDPCNICHVCFQIIQKSTQSWCTVSSSKACNIILFLSNFSIISIFSFPCWFPPFPSLCHDSQPIISWIFLSSCIIAKFLRCASISPRPPIDGLVNFPTWAQGITCTLNVEVICN